MVQWITKQIGIKSFNEELKEEDFGTIIVDLSDVKADGTNEDKVIYNVITRIFAVVAARKYKVILQSKEETIAPLFAAVVIAYSVQMNLDDTIKIVKGKKKLEINEELVNSCKKVLELMAVG